MSPSLIHPGNLMYPVVFLKDSTQHLLHLIAFRGSPTFLSLDGVIYWTTLLP